MQLITVFIDWWRLQKFFGEINFGRRNTWHLFLKQNKFRLTYLA